MSDNINFDEGAEDWDDEDMNMSETIRAKWTMDGATTLEEAAVQLEQFAALLRKGHEDGFVLEGPINDDYGFVTHPEGKTLFEYE